MPKRFYWLKLKTDFFSQREVKKLRKIAGGDTYTIIYLKMQLLSIKTNGIITFEQTEERLDEQLALELDEDLDNVKMTLSFLNRNGLIEPISELEYMMPKVVESIGCESDSAERVRKFRQKNEQKALQCNTEVTNGNENVTLEIRDKRIELENRDKSIELELECASAQTNEKLIPILNAWNLLNLSQIKSINKGTNRHKLLISRIKEYGIDEVVRAIENIDLSSFLKGQNKSGWTITFDWFVKPNNFIKVLEGNYNDTHTEDKSGFLGVLNQMYSEVEDG